MEIGFQKIIYVNYLIAFIGNLPYSLSIAHKQFIILVVIYENTRLLVDVDSMLVDRLPRRPKIKTPLAQYLYLFRGYEPEEYLSSFITGVKELNNIVEVINIKY